MYKQKVIQAWLVEAEYTTRDGNRHEQPVAFITRKEADEYTAAMLKLGNDETHDYEITVAQRAICIAVPVNWPKAV